MHDDQATISDQPEGDTATPRVNPNWGKPFLAAVLSLLFTGLGQAYNRNWKRTLMVVVVSLFLDILFLRMGVWATFRGLILLFASLFLWRIWTAVDAATEARRQQRNPVTVTWAITLGAVAIVIGGAALEASDWFYPLATFRAFRIPSGSMCPTICVGDRIVADVRSFRGKEPQRGDVVMFVNEPSPGLFVKRVAAVGGDEVSSRDGRLEVNKSPVARITSACGTPASQRGSDYQPPPDMAPMRIPEHHIFVIGDDLDNSFDSRHFGPVDESQLRGRPLYLYWSATRSRIGCAIK